MSEGDGSSLEELVQFYSRQRGDADGEQERLQQLYQSYATRSEAAAMDAAAVAAALEIGDINAHADPRVLEAFHLQYPNVDIHDLSHYTSDQLQGFTNGVKGKLFEILIRDRLNNGDWVGDIHLSAGEHAVLADSAAQPGWDLQILDGHGHAVDHLQAKATDSLAYIREALEKYPHIHVITDLPGADHMVSGVIDAHVHDGAIDAMSQHGIEELSHNFFQEFAHHVNPLVPAIVITMTEGYQVLVGRSTLERAARHGLSRLGKSLGAMSAAALLHAWNVPGLFCVGGSVATRMGIEAYLNRCRVTDVVEAYDQALEQLMGRAPARASTSDVDAAGAG